MLMPEMLVVCVDDSPMYQTLEPSMLTRGRIYTVKDVYYHPAFAAVGGAVTLYETRPPRSEFLFVGYRATRFRPARLSTVTSWTDVKVPEEVD